MKNLFILSNRANLLKSLEGIVAPYFILLHVAQVAISCNKYPKSITQILSVNHTPTHSILENNKKKVTIDVEMPTS